MNNGLRPQGQSTEEVGIGETTFLIESANLVIHTCGDKRD